MEKEPVTLELLQLNRGWAYNYLVVSVFMVCDTFWTLPREVQYIWSSAWSLPKILYIMVRYYGVLLVMFHTIMTTSQQVSLPMQGVSLVFFDIPLTSGGPAFVVALVNVILVKRVHSLYHGRRSVTIILGILLCGSTVAWAYNAATLGPKGALGSYLEPPDLPIFGCPTTYSGEYTMSAWSTEIAVGVLLFGMTISWYAIELQLTCADYIRRGRLSPLLWSFVTDGVVYFVVHILSMGVGAILSLWLKNPHHRKFYVPWFLATITTSGSRLILHLREAAATDASFMNTSVVLGSVGGHEFHAAPRRDIQISTDD